MYVSPTNAATVQHGQPTKILYGCIRITFELSHVQSLYRFNPALTGSLRGNKQAGNHSSRGERDTGGKRKTLPIARHMLLSV